MRIFGILFFSLMFFSHNLFADKASECTRLWQLEKELECPAPQAEKETTGKAEEKNITSDFGPTKCVITELTSKEAKPLKTECESWVKERKTELGSKYLTGTCNQSCRTCEKNTSLKQCSIKGEVHYLIQ